MSKYIHNSCVLQDHKLEVKNWSAFMASLHETVDRNKHLDPDWAGSMRWNNAWDQALDSEAEKQQQVQDIMAQIPARGAGKAGLAASGV